MSIINNNINVQSAEDARIYEIFPIPIYETILDEDDASKNFLEANKDWINFGDEYGKKSKDTYILDNLECNKLKENILKHLVSYAQKNLCWNIDSVKILQSWISVKLPDQQHLSHYHPNSAISGIYYFNDIGLDQSPITFQRNPVICQLMTQFSPDYNEEDSQKITYPWSQFVIHPQKNMLILFPSWVHHSVPLNTSKKERKSLSFNVVPTGIFGSNSLTTEFDID